MSSGWRLYKAGLMTGSTLIVLSLFILILFLLPMGYEGEGFEVYKYIWGPIQGMAVFIPFFILFDHCHIKNLRESIVVTRTTAKKRMGISNFSTLTSSISFTILAAVTLAIKFQLIHENFFIKENGNALILCFLCFFATSLAYKTLYLFLNNFLIPFAIILTCLMTEYLLVTRMEIPFRLLLAPAFIPYSFLSSLLQASVVILAFEFFYYFSECQRKEDIR